MGRRPNHGHQLIGALLVTTTMTAAAVIVAVTHDTAGLADLSTLVLTLASAIPLVTSRQRRAPWDRGPDRPSRVVEQSDVDGQLGGGVGLRPARPQDRPDDLAAPERG